MTYQFHLHRKPKFERLTVDNLQNEETEVTHVEFMLVRMALAALIIWSLTFSFASIYAIPKIQSSMPLLSYMAIYITCCLVTFSQLLYVQLPTSRLRNCFAGLFFVYLPLFAFFFHILVFRTKAKNYMV